jgi:hypothetical protein
MKREIHNIHTELPDCCCLYLFGSAVESKNPRDLDVLIVYDEAFTSPSTSYYQFSSLVQALPISKHYPIHLTLLTVQEAQDTDFVSKSQAIRIIARQDNV